MLPRLESGAGKVCEESVTSAETSADGTWDSESAATSGEVVSGKMPLSDEVVALTLLSEELEGWTLYCCGESIAQKPKEALGGAAVCFFF